ncbi:MAG: hypothetical protein QM731_14910 [Chitinophagaceae bacterium]
MKESDYRGLWSKIQSFDFDEPDSKIKFSDKLAAQQKWNSCFTEKAIAEYRRFLLLCCISPHGASPSKVVDEVWHLHLTYTKSYWTDLCKHVLEKELHHHPSRGGDDEDEKHRRWYRETLLLYQVVFDESPPVEIWPPPDLEIIRYPDPDLSTTPHLRSVVTLILAIPFVFSSLLFAKLSPYDLKGPQFLVFFSLLVTAAFVSFLLIQQYKNEIIKQWLSDLLPRDLSIFQLTWYMYGHARALQTCIVGLVRRGLIEPERGGLFRVRNDRYGTPVTEDNPLVPAFLQEPKGAELNYEMIATNWNKREIYHHPVMAGLEEFVNDRENYSRKYWIFCIVFLVAIIRMVQAEHYHKPFAYLVMICFITIGAITIVGHQTSRKKTLFNKCRQWYFVEVSSGAYHPDEVVRDFAYRGNPAIEMYSDGMFMAMVFDTINGKQVVSDSGFSASCGSDGGDGGGSCGSGGCGGGCGGCGGGD